VRSSASSFKSQPLLVSLRSSTSCSRFLPRLPVTSVFPSVKRRRQFICKMWTIKLDFVRFILCATVYNTNIYLYLCLMLLNFLNSKILSPNRGIEYVLIQKSQQDAHVTEFILSGDCSTCFGYHYHPSSGAHSLFYRTYCIFRTIYIINNNCNLIYRYSLTVKI